jgi:hypothetical protein
VSGRANTAKLSEYKIDKRKRRRRQVVRANAIIKMMLSLSIQILFVLKEHRVFYFIFIIISFAN